MRKKFLFIVWIFCISISTFVSATSNLYPGIDVSNWQEYVNYQEVANDGIQIVYIKATQGSDIVDSYFRTNYENAKSAGLKIGFYHFLTASTTQEAESQAQFFTSTISGLEADCRLAMDFEIFNRT